MGLFDFLQRLIYGASAPAQAPTPTRGVDELARCLGMSIDELHIVTPEYRTFDVPKRNGGVRTIHAPVEPFKAFQRRLLRRVLSHLPVHPAAVAFERGSSIVHHATRHASRPVVVRLDIRDFFSSTATKRVGEYFRAIGWSDEAATLLTDWTTHDGSLPQGAPTSPKLANAANFRLDHRITAAIRALQHINPKTLDRVATAPGGIEYSRYADDLTFSFDRDDHGLVNSSIQLVKRIVEDEGYRLHTKKKLRIMRRHDRQQVTGLVVNAGVNLPRGVRRRLRAIEHHLATGRDASMTLPQLAGWRSLQRMIASQTGRGERR